MQITLNPNLKMRDIVPYRTSILCKPLLLTLYDAMVLIYPQAIREASRRHDAPEIPIPHAAAQSRFYGSSQTFIGGS